MQVVKKNVIENIIPIVIALKHKLEEMKSGLLDDLMAYLREVMKDYKNEVKEILAADKQLATEIQYDLKKWEEEQAEIRRQQEEERVSALFYNLGGCLTDVCSSLRVTVCNSKWHQLVIDYGILLVWYELNFLICVLRHLISRW